MNPALTHGAFSWSELITADPDAAIKFYGALLGWTNKTMPMPQGHYHLQMIGQQPVAGIMAPPQPGLPTAWAYYITVNDVDAVADHASKLGAKVVVPPTDIPTVGRFSGLQDPQGVYFHVIAYEQPADGGEMPDVKFADAFGMHGAFSWFQLVTTDPKGAIEFYSTLLGWNVEEQQMPSGPYNTINVDGVGVGGIMKVWSDEVPPHWGAYVTVDDVEAATKTAESSGGQVVVPPTDIPSVGRFTAVQDPTGGVLNFIKYVPMGQEA